MGTSASCSLKLTSWGLTVSPGSRSLRRSVDISSSSLAYRVARCRTHSISSWTSLFRTACSRSHPAAPLHAARQQTYSCCCRTCVWAQAHPVANDGSVLLLMQGKAQHQKKGMTHSCPVSQARRNRQRIPQQHRHHTCMSMTALDLRKTRLAASKRSWSSLAAASKMSRAWAAVTRRQCQARAGPTLGLLVPMRVPTLH